MRLDLGFNAIGSIISARCLPDYLPTWVAVGTLLRLVQQKQGRACESAVFYPEANAYSQALLDKISLW